MKRFYRAAASGRLDGVLGVLTVLMGLALVVGKVLELWAAHIAAR